MRLIILGCIVLFFCSCATQHERSLSTKKVKAAAINVQLGAGYIAKSEYKLADEKLLRAFEQDPNSSVARWTYAILQEKLRRPEMAVTYYKKALAINPQDVQGRYNYAAFLCRQSRYKDASEHFKQALNNPIYTGREMGNLLAGVCAMEIPDYELAKKYFKRVLTLKRNNYIALYQMAKLYFLQKNYAMAQNFMRDFEEVSKHTEKSLWIAYQIERKLGNIKISQSYARELQTNFRDSAETKKLSRVE